MNTQTRSKSMRKAIQCLLILLPSCSVFMLYDK